MSSSPLTTEKKTLNDLNTVAGVVAELSQGLATYEVMRKGLLKSWRLERKHLRALLAVLEDKESKESDSDQGKKGDRDEG